MKTYNGMYMYRTVTQQNYCKATTRVSFPVRQGVWVPARSPAGPGQSPGKRSRGQNRLKLWLYFKLQGYFGYENDRTHVIKEVVLVVQITIQLTYGVHGFKKKAHTTTSLFNGHARTTRISRKQIF